MAKTRIDVPQKLADELHHACKHTCCICREPRHPVEIHHIDEDPSNNTRSNLVVLCRNCHGTVSMKGPMGRRYSPGEIRRFKSEWEAECTNQEGELEAFVEVRQTLLVRAGEHITFEYDLEAPDIVWARVSSTEPVGLNFASENDYAKWMEDGECDLRAGAESVFEASIDDVIEEDDTYVLWIDADDADAKVTLDFLVWRAPSDGDGDEDGVE